MKNIRFVIKSKTSSSNRLVGSFKRTTPKGYVVIDVNGKEMCFAKESLCPATLYDEIRNLNDREIKLLFGYKLIFAKIYLRIRELF